MKIQVLENGKYIDAGSVTLDSNNTVHLDVYLPDLKELFLETPCWVGSDTPKIYTPKDGKDYMDALYYRFVRSSSVLMFEEPDDGWLRELEKKLYGSESA